MKKLVDLWAGQFGFKRDHGQQVVESRFFGVREIFLQVTKGRSYIAISALAQVGRNNRGNSFQDSCALSSVDRALGYEPRGRGFESLRARFSSFQHNIYRGFTRAV